VTSPAAGTAAFAPGARLGPYEILAPIGAGGMGEVYRARDTRLGRDVAVKVIAFDVSSDSDRLRRFEQEARAVAALNHPNILSVYDVGTEAGAPYVVFELLEGESLRQRLGREALPARKAVDWASQIARGLAAAHDRGIVHRDLKPENLFVTKDARVKILDFGLAKLLLGEDTVKEASDSSTLSEGTSPGTLLGTVGYLSPEQVRGQAVDPRSDIFSLGAVLYEMLSGRRAFRRGTAADTLTAILKEDPPELASAQGPLPPALDRIVRRCLEKDPAERFRSAHDLAFDLETLSALLGLSVTSPSLLPGKPRLAQILAAALILGAVGLVTFFAGRRAGFVAGERAQPAPRGEVRFQLTPPAGLRRHLRRPTFA
jgi:serine/threonine protein kinase